MDILAYPFENIILFFSKLFVFFIGNFLLSQRFGLFNFLFFFNSLDLLSLELVFFDLSLSFLLSKFFLCSLFL
jgi:hypothetical protein